MEIKIGVQYAPRELSIESDETAEALEKQVADALSAGGVLALLDHKGRKVLIAADKITYVEIGSSTTPVVGFRS